jgi:Tfp pilus assembly protein PilV
MKSAKTRRAIGRSKQRGTAMMEALMVNIVLVILLAGVVFFQATYSAKIKSVQNTRAYAWAYGLHGCNTSDIPSNEELAIQENFGSPNSETDSSNEGDVKGELGQTGNSVPDTGTKLDNDSNYTNNVFGTGQGVAGSNVGTVNATSSVQMTSFNMLKIQGAVMTASSHVQCNPTPASELNVAQVAIQAARNLANW